MSDDTAATKKRSSAENVGAFYERQPYPPPVDDIDAYRATWNDERRRAESSLFWPSEPYRDDRSILVAGCGTAQAAHYAVRWPNARVVGIDVSANSIAFTEHLKSTYGLANLEVRQLPIENAAELDASFDYVVCTGVLHHLADPGAGLRALRDVVVPSGALNLMVYAPYGRAGVYMLQDYCRRLRIGATDEEIRDLVASLQALPADHPIVNLLRNSPDFASAAGVADALLHPRDRSYSVPELMHFIRSAGLIFGRWIRQAPYLPYCGAIASTPHSARLTQLTPDEQFAAMELFRGTMARHSLIAYRNDSAADDNAVTFDGDSWLDYVPIRLPNTVVVNERLPPGAAAVLINRSHTYTDLYLPVDAESFRLFGALDGTRSIARVCESNDDKILARTLFERLWRWDQIVFDTSAARSPKPVR